MLELPAAALLKQRVGFVLAGVEVVLAIAPATGVAMEPGAVGGPGDEVVTGLVHDFDDCGACGTSMLLMPPAYAGGYVADVYGSRNWRARWATSTALCSKVYSSTVIQPLL